jgi:hypothetical protein
MALRHVRKRTWVIGVCVALVVGLGTTAVLRHYLAGLRAQTVYRNALANNPAWAPQGELVGDADFVTGALRTVTNVQSILFAGSAYGPGGAAATPTIVLLTSEEKYAPWAHKVLTLWKVGRSWQVSESGLWSSRNPVMTLPVRPANLLYPQGKHDGTVVMVARGTPGITVHRIDGRTADLTVAEGLAFIPAAAGGDRPECLVYEVGGQQVTSPGMEVPVRASDPTALTDTVKALHTARGCTRGASGSTDLAIGADEPMAVQARGRVPLTSGSVDAFSVRRWTYEASLGTVLLAGSDGVLIGKPVPWTGYAAGSPPLAVTVGAGGGRPALLVVDAGRLESIPKLPQWSGGDTTVIEGAPPIGLVTLGRDGVPSTTLLVPRG